MRRGRTPRRRGLALAAAVAVAVIGFPPATSAAGAPEEGIERLAWLAGCWKRETPAKVVEEMWMAPRGGMMLGTSRAVSKPEGGLVEFEAMRIEEREGRLVFTAKPSGQPEAAFTSIQLTDSLVVFENAEHDFPQRVGYRLSSGGGLEAWIEGRRHQPAGPASPDAPSRRVDFPYDRARCP